jgi:hypothetical protein
MSQIKIEGFRTLFPLHHSDHAETRSTPGPQPKSEKRFTAENAEIAEKDAEHPRASTERRKAIHRRERRDRRERRREGNSLGSYVCQHFKKLRVTSVESNAFPVTFQDNRLLIRKGRSRVAFSINLDDTEWPGPVRFYLRPELREGSAKVSRESTISHRVCAVHLPLMILLAAPATSGGMGAPEKFDFLSRTRLLIQQGRTVI